MEENSITLKVNVAGKEGQFLFDKDCPAYILREMFFQFQKYIEKAEDQVKAAQEKQNQEDQKPE